jgi:hypothetical protein
MKCKKVASIIIFFTITIICWPEIGSLMQQNGVEMGSDRAYVTLLTNDYAAKGVLVTAYTLRKTGTSHPFLVLVSPGVSEKYLEVSMENVKSYSLRGT